ncbi:MAG: sugar phosphate nucleotidyltransferase [Micromonosporaceae bacterium]
MLYVVIPAGGSGTRLWPLSRAGRPKFLLPLVGGGTLLQRTADRLGPLTTPERTYVVTGKGHADEVARQLPELPGENLLVEPSPRDSCAAIALAAAVIARRSPGAMMGSFAADHLITGVERFRQVVREAVTGAERGLLMTVGIAPTRPETGYGYLRCGQPVGDGPVRMVEEFTEKPSGEVARAYVESGSYLWNASIFVWRVEVFLAELARRCPELHDGVVRIAEAWDTGARDQVLAQVWPTLPKISVDYAVMEPAAADGRVATVPGDFGWYDLGDFNTLAEVLPGDEAGNVTAEGNGSVLLRDASGSVVVPGSGRTVAVLGVKDLVIVDTPDALLVCPRDRAQDVKQLVDELRSRGEACL